MFEHPNVLPLTPIEYELVRADQEIQRLQALAEEQARIVVQQRSAIFLLLGALTRPT